MHVTSPLLVEVPMHQNTPHPTPAAPGPDPLGSPALLINRCASCATSCAPLTAICPVCHGTELAAVPSTGTGAIVSWKATPGPQADTDPAVTAIVELDDGPRLYTWIEGEIPARASHPVRVEFRPTPRGHRFPVFAVRAS
ncbi:hypothetical protein GCM10023094_12080 [Rhodococcus olei]|uniref:ChsH2 C-terminal OB-fold domain-containing protein n=1 Tax=Rhodococcus olei TaxID=2161675 RepID=A0ABP8NZ43_9NOCA